MDDAKEHLIALVKADADAARQRAKRLRLLSEYVVGNTEQMLRQADMELAAAEGYDKICQNMRKAWGL